jgi:hypothetical protein
MTTPHKQFDRLFDGSNAHLLPKTDEQKRKEWWESLSAKQRNEYEQIEDGTWEPNLND